MTETSTLTIKETFKRAGIHKPPESRRVLLETLNVDTRYQRNHRDKLIREAVANFNPTACGVLIVNLRADGKEYIVDGNNRRIILQQLGVKYWGAHYTRGLTAHQEAEIWRVCQTQRANATAVERFRERLFNEEPIAVSIKNLVEGYNCHLVLERIRQKSSYRQVGAVAALDTIWKWAGEEALKTVFEVIVRSWSEDERHATDRVALLGLFRFIFNRSWKDIIDQNRLVETLSKISVQKLIRRAMCFHETQGGDVSTLFADAVWKEYNKGARGKLRLPPRILATDDDLDD